MFDFTITSDKKLLKEISRKLDILIARGSDGDTDKIKKAASDLDTSTNELKQAVDKNTPL